MQRAAGNLSYGSRTLQTTKGVFPFGNPSKMYYNCFFKGIGVNGKIKEIKQCK
jgi:hypothetical protein